MPKILVERPVGAVTINSNLPLECLMFEHLTVIFTFVGDLEVTEGDVSFLHAKFWQINKKFLFFRRLTRR